MIEPCSSGIFRQPFAHFLSPHLLILSTVYPLPICVLVRVSLFSKSILGASETDGRTSAVLLVACGMSSSLQRSAKQLIGDTTHCPERARGGDSCRTSLQNIPQPSLHGLTFPLQYFGCLILYALGSRRPCFSTEMWL